MELATVSPRPSGIRRENLAREVVRYIREEILSGRLRPGTKIDQNQIAEALDVSKIPVREALLVLSADGLVEILPRRGAYVGALTPADILDHYSIFGLVAGLAAERAATALSDSEISDLDALQRQMEESSDAVELGRLNYRFHEIINRSGSTRHLAAVLRGLSEVMSSRFFEFTGGDEATKGSINEEHRQILEALRSRDQAVASERIRAHFHASGAKAVASLDAIGFWRGDDS